MGTTRNVVANPMYGTTSGDEGLLAARPARQQQPQQQALPHLLSPKAVESQHGQSVSFMAAIGAGGGRQQQAQQRERYRSMAPARTHAGPHPRRPAPTPARTHAGAMQQRAAPKIAKGLQRRTRRHAVAVAAELMRREASAAAARIDQHQAADALWTEQRAPPAAARRHGRTAALQHRR
jgi:hypothetical protein